MGFHDPAPRRLADALAANTLSEAQSSLLVGMGLVRVFLGNAGAPGTAGPEPSRFHRVTTLITFSVSPGAFRPMPGDNRPSWSAMSASHPGRLITYAMVFGIYMGSAFSPCGGWIDIEAGLESGSDGPGGIGDCAASTTHGCATLQRAAGLGPPNKRRWIRVHPK